MNELAHPPKKKRDPASKACTTCTKTLLLCHFPQKGKGRREHKCKICHNANKREKRRKNAISKWSLFNIHVRERLMEASEPIFVETLFSTMKTHGFLGKDSVPADASDILKRESSVDALLGTKEKT